MVVNLVALRGSGVNPDGQLGSLFLVGIMIVVTPLAFIGQGPGMLGIL